MQTHVLVLNAGSSSLKFALYRTGENAAAELAGRVDRIGTPAAALLLHGEARTPRREDRLGATDGPAALDAILERCADIAGPDRIAGVGHRVVHSGPHLHAPVRIDAAVIDLLRQVAPYDPAHQVPALAHIEAIAARWPHKPQVACFDTTFHAALPALARRLPLPRRFAERGLRRYGFHGLSYTHLMDELRRLEPALAASGRLVLAHLGNGASLAAIRAGQPIDTTMGFSPNSGVPMSTRSAELDPGAMLWLAREERMSAEQIADLALRHAGLLAISGTSGDLRELLARERNDPRAAEAVAFFCYHVQKAIGGLAAALGGLDALVFSGGVGEHAAPIRARVCAGLQFLGIALDAQANDAHAAVISAAGARVIVRVIPTDEELVIARETRRVLALTPA